MRRLTTQIESFDLKQPFTISTGSIDCLVVLKTEIRDGIYVGRGECVPSAANMVSAARGREFAALAQRQILAIRTEVEGGASRQELLDLLPGGPARNAVDCALWDLEAKLSGVSVAESLNAKPAVLTTAVTVGLADPASMSGHTKAMGARELIKLKLGGSEDVNCVAAVRDVAPESTIIVDVNGGWTIDELREMDRQLKSYDVSLIEQPLAAGEDAELSSYDGRIPLCADESCQDHGDLNYVSSRYQYINIKLDKCGGLTEALTMVDMARQFGLRLVVGCMSGTSLSMVPAGIIGRMCEFVDLDGPMLLNTDRRNSLDYDAGRVVIERPDIWG